MTALKQLSSITIAEYLAGEELSDAKHVSKTPAVVVHRRKSEGGFAVEAHSRLAAVIPLPEVDASLPLAELYKQVVFS